MALLVDTSVWSLAYRRDTPPDLPEVTALRRALTGGDAVVTTGMILLELLRGFVPAKAQETIRAAFEWLEFVEPSRDDYVSHHRPGLPSGRSTRRPSCLASSSRMTTRRRMERGSWSVCAAEYTDLVAYDDGSTAVSAKVRTSVYLDRDLADYVARELGTRTLTDTLDVALREIAIRRARQELPRLLAEAHDGTAFAELDAARETGWR